MNGGALTFYMAPQANENFGVEKEQRPETIIKDFLICSPPTIFSESQTFNKELMIEMQNHTQDAQIFYTTNGSQPDLSSNLYSEPIKIKETTEFKMIALHPEFGKSSIVSSIFYQIDDSKSIDLTNEYSPLYPAGGDLALIDQIRGNDNFKTGTWQGYHDRNIEAILSFKNKKRIEEIGIGMIQDQGSWIFFPSKVSFYISENKKDWIKVGEVKNSFDQKTSPLTHDFSIKVYPKKVKHIKVVAENAGACPDWHLGAGGATWLFADEIWVK